MKYPYLCLDCDEVFYVSRYREGETLCPRCAGRAHVPLWSILPPFAGGAVRTEQGPKVVGVKEVRRAV